MVSFENDITQCLQTLSAGGLILYPTDTIWGIGCDATNTTAVENIYRLKNRPDKKSMIILVANENEIDGYVKSLDQTIFVHLKNKKKPTTVIYNNAFNLPKNLINEDGSIAIRIVQDEFCKQLIQQFKKPVVSTSANISGETSPKNFTEISAQIKNGVDFIVQHRRDDLGIYQPSSIIKFTEEGKIIVIRE